MKAVRGAEGGVVVVDLDEPPGVGEVLDMRSTSVCASDFLYLRFGSRKIIGHELAGVRADGTAVAVAVAALYGCMECEQCRRGTYNLCPTHGQRALGLTADGGMAEQLRAPPARLVPLPPGLDVRDASIVEPASGWGPASVARVPTTSSWRRRARRRASPEPSSSWHPTGPSSCSACTWAPSSWTGCRSSTARHASSRRSATAATTGAARWRTRPRRWRRTPTSPVR